MRRFLALLMPVLACAAHPAAAQEIAYDAVSPDDVLTYTVLEIVTEGGDDAAAGEETVSAERAIGVRFAPPPAATTQGLAAYGPFRVLDGNRAALVEVTDGSSPQAFAAMLRDYPGIATLEMIECPGTYDDRANLRLGLMIRNHAIATHVPDGGFVGSGAVELFLAGARRQAESSAVFAVHSWQDDLGREARDYAADAPENRLYLDYYQAVGFSPAEARAFYAMTNSVPFTQAKWLTAGEMAQWVRLDPARDMAAVRLDSVPTLQ